MSTRTVWSDPELYLEHGGVRVFNTYDDDDMDQCVQKFLFTLNPECSVEESRCENEACPHVFDVRDLTTWQPPEQPPFCTGANDTPANREAWKNYWQEQAVVIRAAVISAINNGELTDRGARLTARKNSDDALRDS